MSERRMENNGMTGQLNALESQRLASAFGLEPKQFWKELRRYLIRTGQDSRIRGFQEAFANPTIRPNAETCVIWAKFLAEVEGRLTNKLVDRDYVHRAVEYCSHRAQSAVQRRPTQLFKGLEHIIENISELAGSMIERRERSYCGCYTLVRKARDRDVFYEEVLCLKGRHEITQNLVFERVVLSGVTIFSSNIATVFLYSPDSSPRLTFRVLEILFPLDGIPANIYSGIALGVAGSVSMPVAVPIVLFPATSDTTNLLEREGLKSRTFSDHCVKQVQHGHARYDLYKKLPLDRAIKADHEELVKTLNGCTRLGA